MNENEANVNENVTEEVITPVTNDGGSRITKTDIAIGVPVAAAAVYGVIEGVRKFVGWIKKRREKKDDAIEDVVEVVEEPVEVPEEQ